MDLTQRVDKNEKLPIIKIGDIKEPKEGEEFSDVEIFYDDEEVAKLMEKQSGIKNPDTETMEKFIAEMIGKALTGEDGYDLRCIKDGLIDRDKQDGKT